MTSVKTKAAALALGFGLATALVAPPALAAKKDQPAAAPSGPNLSQEVRTNLVAAQTALKANDTATALAKVAAAKAAATTDDDRYYASAQLFDISRTTNDPKQQSEAIDGMIASGKAPAEQLPVLLNAQGQIAYAARDYKKAQASFEQAAKLQPKGDLLILVAETRRQNGDVPGALAAAQQAVDTQKASGQPVPAEWYQRALAIAYEAKRTPDALKWSEALLQAYPTAGNWRDALVIYRDTNQLDDQTQLDLMRLMRAAHALKGERDYYEYANMAFNRGYPGEAAAVIQEGQAANMVPATSKPLAELKGLATPKVAADKASLPGLEKRARSAADAKLAISTADAYLGYGEWAKAADLYRVALTKSGADANLINTRLGIALARSGDKAGAAATFAKVTGPRQQLAQFWTLWVNQQA